MTSKKTSKELRIGKMSSLTFWDFIREKIPAIEADTGYSGVQPVYSGLNAALMAEFSLTMPQVLEATDVLVEAGKLIRVPQQGGVRLFLPSNPPTRGNNDAKVARILGLGASGSRVGK